MSDLVGIQMGRLTAIERIVKNSRSYYLCECECGNTKIVYGNHLKTGVTKSCGCLSREMASERAMTNGGLSLHFMYAIWRAQYDRCYNIENKKYRNYGSKGIQCLWTLEEACRWADENPRPVDENGKNYHCDRIDNKGNYELCNVRWLSHADNQLNTNKSTTIYKYIFSPTLEQTFTRGCHRNGIDAADFEKILSDESLWYVNPKNGNRRKTYFFKLSKNYEKYGTTYDDYNKFIEDNMV